MIDIRMQKTAKILSILLMSFMFIMPAHAETTEIEFQVANMLGLTDQYKVRKILSGLEGIEKVILVDEEKSVLLTFDDEFSSLFDIKTALASQGYPATDIENAEN